MTIEQDEAWVAQARARIAAGQSWERNADEIASALFIQRIKDASESARPLNCPFCERARPLERLPGSLAAATPPLYCPVCLGVWATGSALIGGFGDAASDMPALRAPRSPRICRFCREAIPSEGDCRRCGRSLPSLLCPSCRQPMQRFRLGGVDLDACDPCRGTWFDAGEVATVYGIASRSTEPASSVAAADAAQESGNPRLAMALDIAFLLLRFLT